VNIIYGKMNVQSLSSEEKNNDLTLNALIDMYQREINESHAVNDHIF